MCWPAPGAAPSPPARLRRAWPALPACRVGADEAHHKVAVLLSCGCHGLGVGARRQRALAAHFCACTHIPCNEGSGARQAGRGEHRKLTRRRGDVCGVAQAAEASTRSPGGSARHGGHLHTHLQDALHRPAGISASGQSMYTTYIYLDRNAIRSAASATPTNQRTCQQQQPSPLGQAHCL